ncbi:histidine phosphatase family protein [Salisediminibacterium beveridgei]|nr:histidine phosphatase family protein [Salisediminibacterium beveridgei]
MNEEQVIYFVRHGQSEANKHGIIQGHAEFPLSKLGQMQAKLAADWFVETKLNEIFSSDLSRARFTAEAIGHRQNNGRLHVHSEPLVREVGLGPLEGMTREQMADQFPEMKSEALLTSGIDGTETIEAITLRCEKLTEKLTDLPSGNIAVVSHGGFISIYLMYLIIGSGWHKANRPFVIGNTGITKVVFTNGTPKIHYTNNQQHLQTEGDLTSSTVVY